MPSIVGTWKLARAAARDAAGAALPEPYGGNGIGRLTFTAEGRMMSVVCDGRPELPAGTRRESRGSHGWADWESPPARSTTAAPASPTAST